MLALHHGTVDLRPLQKSLLSCNRTQVLNSLTVQIHSPNAVVIRTVATGLTAENMQFFTAVPWFRMATFWASLTGMPWIHGNGPASTKPCFILNLFAKIVKGPGYSFIPAFQTYLFCNIADTSQVFQDEQGACRGGLIEDGYPFRRF